MRRAGAGPSNLTAAVGIEPFVPWWPLRTEFGYPTYLVSVSNNAASKREGGELTLARLRNPMTGCSMPHLSQVHVLAQDFGR